MKTIFDLCEPRADVLEGRVKDEEFAADLAAVVNGQATKEYADPDLFFRHTYPTRGMKALLEAVCRRLSGAGGELNSVIRLDTAYGGGKTHSLIALVHAVRGMQGVQNAAEFVDPALLPSGRVRVAALDGENSTPADGLKLEDGLFAHSLWGEMAYRLAGREGFDRVKNSDKTHTAPGAETIAELFGGEPTLILIDEVSVYLRKVSLAFPDAAGQFSAFLQALIKAVASNPKVALVMTLAVSAKEKEAQDAYRQEQQQALDAFAEAESIVSRKLLQLDPTEEDETVNVLRRRLFNKVDIPGAAEVVDAYLELWKRNSDHLSDDALSPEVREQFKQGYPLHPETMSVMMEKMSSLSTFQRTRGMLRILARTVAHLWKIRPEDAFAIHPHHIDPTNAQIRGELTTRLNQQAYSPVLAADVAAVTGKDPATAQRIDAREFAGQPPVASYVARTIFLNTLAYGEAAQGITPDHLRYAVCSPLIEPSFVEAARKAFVADSLYLDDRPAAPMRLRVEPNLTQIVQRAMRDNVDTDELDKTLSAKVRQLFAGKSGGFSTVEFPAASYDIQDDIGEGRPYLVVLHHDAFALSETPTDLPQDLVRMATKKGIKEETRLLRNNLVFVVADKRLRSEMKNAMRRRLALEFIQNSDQFSSLADYQQRKINEDFDKSRTAVAVNILQCYRHLFYPSPSGIGGNEARLSHTSIELQNASDAPGNGQQHIKRALGHQKKLLSAGDEPDAPTYVRDQTPLKTKGQLSTQDLRNEFRRAPNLSILLDDEPLIACIQRGIEHNVFIYREGDLVWGKGDPAPAIRISANAFVHTLANAEQQKLWPRPEPEPEPEPDPAPGDSGRDEGDGAGGGGGATGVAEPAPASASSFSAEAPLRQALVQIFSKARAQKVEAFRSVSIKFFDPTSAWSMHQTAATYPAADTVCTFKLELQAEGVEKLIMEFTGVLAKANSIKSFLEPQLRTFTEHEFDAVYTLTFKEPLATAEASARAFIEAMTRYGGGEAFVEAVAAATQEA